MGLSFVQPLELNKTNDFVRKISMNLNFKQYHYIEIYSVKHLDSDQEVFVYIIYMFIKL